MIQGKVWHWLIVFLGCSLLGSGLRAREVDTAPIPNFRADPTYPAELRKAGVEGSAEIEFIVNTNGDVRNARVVSSTHIDFGEAALAAVGQWKFKPGMKEGRAVYTRMKVPIVFSLNAEPPPGRLPVTLGLLGRMLGSGVASRVQSNDSGAVYPFEDLIKNKQGAVDCAVLISVEGAVADTTWPGQPDPNFRLAVEALLDVTRFPAAVEDGRAVERVRNFTWVFNPYDGDIRISDSAAAILKRLRLEGDAAQFAESQELDRALKAYEGPLPVFPSRLPPSVEAGEAVIEFYVDKSGRPQLPRIVSATEPAFGYAACQAIVRWRFNPPRIQGQPTVARVQLPVNFKRK